MIKYESRKPKIELTALIDIMFSLVLFFVVFTTFRTYEASINLQLPKASTGESALKSLMVISVDRNGDMYLLDKPLSEEQILASVKTRIAENPEEVIIIRADEQIPYLHVIKAMDIVQAGGGYNISLAVESNQ
ncbi:MAG: biopolymer transporter ExbD [Firmicutes bacterium]|nr:biopolymer transporter ExbD [Bacillota bacterium]MDD4264385.1 biopolymer transporter ExbD [Bacillota bacterium]MDD4694532.1 biopolymer transporter ExbD [Bacillota bacterium]